MVGRGLVIAFFVFCLPALASAHSACGYQLGATASALDLSAFKPLSNDPVADSVTLDDERDVQIDGRAYHGHLILTLQHNLLINVSFVSPCSWGDYLHAMAAVLADNSTSAQELNPNLFQVTSAAVDFGGNTPPGNAAEGDWGSATVAYGSDGNKEHPALQMTINLFAADPNAMGKHHKPVQQPAEDHVGDAVSVI